jgi:hypothetical protein
MQCNVGNYHGLVKVLGAITPRIKNEISSFIMALSPGLGSQYDPHCIWKTYLCHMMFVPECIQCKVNRSLGNNHKPELQVI